MALRSAVTVMPVLTGLEPDATTTVSSVAALTGRLFGFAVPAPVGGGESGFTVSGMDAVRLRVRDSGRECDRARGVVGGHGGAEGKDVVGRNGVPIGAVIEECLRCGTADGSEISGDGESGAGRVGARRHGYLEQGRAAQHHRVRSGRAGTARIGSAGGRRQGEIVHRE